MIPREILGMPASALYIGSRSWYVTQLLAPQIQQRIDAKIEDDLINGTPPGYEHYKISGLAG